MTLSDTDKKTTLGDIARRWWRSALSAEHGDPATRARLRRCDAPADALTIPAAVALARRLGAVKNAEAEPWRLNAALGLAIVLAHVKEDNAQARVMRAAGWKKFPGMKGDEPPAAEDRPRLSETRFRRLLLTAPESLTTAFVRLVQMLNGEANVADLAESYLDWPDVWRGDRVRQRWAFDYYAAGISSVDETKDTIV